MISCFFLNNNMLLFSVAMADNIVLNFQDSLLRESDVKLLEDGQWLNDKLIGFMFEYDTPPSQYFEYEQFKDLRDVLFVNPDVVQCIKLSEGCDVSIFLGPLEVETKRIIFFPVNNNDKPVSTGGTHWSLLVYDKSLGNFIHYDSAGKMNNSQAKIISNIIEPFLKASKKVGFLEEQCLQQTNSYDCGMYVICVTEYLCKQLGSTVESLSEITSELINEKRQIIKKIIERLRLR